LIRIPEVLKAPFYNHQRIFIPMKIFLSAFSLFFLLIFSQLSAQYITHGPVMGGTTDQSIRMYLRTDSARAFSIEVDLDSNFTNPLSFNNSTVPNLDNSVITDLTGLTADSKYYYRIWFGANLDSLKTGYFRTFPTEGQASSFSFVAGSCQETANMKTYDAIPLHEPLFMLHMGDYTYPSYQLPNTYPADYSMVELSYQRRYEEDVMKDKLLPYIPLVYMPDDDDNFGASRTHHVSAGYSGNSGFANNFFITDTISQLERENCLLGYRQFFPGYPTVDSTEGHYHSFKVANCEFFVLDCRSMADPIFEAYELDSIDNWWAFNPDSTHSIIGQNQMNWLKNGLSNSTADWKFIVSGVPFNRKIRNIIDAGLIIQNLIFNIGGQNGTGFRLSTSFAGYWAGYPDDLNELIAHIQDNNIPRTLFISGDTHHNVMDDGDNSVFPELNASGLSVSTTELAYQIAQYAPLLGQPRVEDSLWNAGGNGLYNQNFKNAFGKVDVYGSDSVRYCVIDEDNIPINCFTIYADGSTYNPLSVEPIMSMEELSSRMKIFPNPSDRDQLLQVELNSLPEEGAHQIQILNLSGQSLQNIPFEVNNKEQFNTQIRLSSDLASGHYIILLKNKSGAIVAIQKLQRY
jgi:hypothetical protein